MTDETKDVDSATSTIDQDGGKARDGWEQSSPPSTAIVEAIAEATERDPTALPPLHRSVDPDALDTLLMQGMQQGEHVHMSFTYDGVRVSVGSDGNLSIQANGTAHEPMTTAPETSADLETALEEFLRAAYRNGVSVTGGYGVRNGPELPDWDIHITNVEKQRDDDS